MVAVVAEQREGAIGPEIRPSSILAYTATSSEPQTHQGGAVGQMPRPPPPLSWSVQHSIPAQWDLLSHGIHSSSLLVPYLDGGEWM